jgi:hypothetical protein
MDEIQEKLAENAHNQWRRWMKYLFNKCSLPNEDGTITIPKWAVDRWKRQIKTSYSDLPDHDKASDREQAVIIWTILGETECDKCKWYEKYIADI